MSTVVRNNDEAKIKDCKEDIDTLLVFVRPCHSFRCFLLIAVDVQAGLFSAVLTAFVVESYTRLTPDPATPSVQLLREISSKLDTFVVSQGFINSTYRALGQVQIFEPDEVAVLINALWFSSLICSLMTASFGMLVKQWLVQYLAGDHFSPQARLRVRQFRYEGLIRWKVFEIAALLPLLLQLSLGLFFLGLCLFTSTVNPTVHKAATPLVLGWALVFFLTTIAPIFSARCPYKIIFLLPAFKAIRKFFRHHLGRRSRFHQMLSQLPASAVVTEEEEAVSTFSNDLRILLAADAMLSDDELLEQTFRPLIAKVRADGPDLIHFVLKIMSRRLPHRPRIRREDLPLLDMRPLSKSAWRGVTGILADALHVELVQDILGDHPPEPLQPWMCDAMRIAVSSSGYAIQESEVEILVYLILYNSSDALMVLRCQQRRLNRHDLTHILHHSRRTLALFHDEHVLSCVWYLVDLCLRLEVRYDRVEDMLAAEDVGEECVAAIGNIFVDALSKKLDDARARDMAWSWEKWVEDALDCIIHASAILEESSEELEEILQFVVGMCRESEGIAHLLLGRITKRENGSSEDECRYKLLGRAMSRLSPDSTGTRAYFPSKFNYSPALTVGFQRSYHNIGAVVRAVRERTSTLDPERLYNVTINIYDMFREARDPQDWQELFQDLLESMRLMHTEIATSQSILQCTDLLDTLSKTGSPEDDFGPASVFSGRTLVGDSPGLFQRTSSSGTNSTNASPTKNWLGRMVKSSSDSWNDEDSERQPEATLVTSRTTAWVRPMLKKNYKIDTPHEASIALQDGFVIE